mmetsp:Transcript_24927/g.69301  ORF Transcript_24927/g.69301 Transcript_24927/m.69301 type:complete len:214 (-) Transcript_24927:1583-2224(-)
MEGRGVQNYALDRPSFAYTDKTTEFDDALMHHGIVTRDQVMRAKGMKTREQETEAQKDDQTTRSTDDDDFLKTYREKRLKEMQQHAANASSTGDASSAFSNVLHIRRGDWKQAVNEASMDRWVVITLVDAHCKDKVRQELHNLQRATAEAEVRLITILSTEAVPNWPASRTPAIFAYRHGLKQNEWIAQRNGQFPPLPMLEQMVDDWNAQGVD